MNRFNYNPTWLDKCRDLEEHRGESPNSGLGSREELRCEGWIGVSQARDLGLEKAYPGGRNDVGSKPTWLGLRTQSCSVRLEWRSKGWGWRYRQMSNGKIFLNCVKEFGLYPEDTGESVNHCKRGIDMIASVQKPHPGCSNGEWIGWSRFKADVTYRGMFIPTQNKKGKRRWSCLLHPCLFVYLLTQDRTVYS